TFALLDRLGTRDRVEMQSSLTVPFIHPVRGAAEFRCPSLPSPTHLMAGVLGYKLLSPRERGSLLLGAIRLVARHLRGDASLRSETVSGALDRAGQGKGERVCFWDPLAIAVLNDLPERASAALFAEVLRRIFLARERASRLVFPRAGLSELYVDAASRIVGESGGAVEMARAVRELVLRDDRVVGVRLADGQETLARGVILATAPSAVESLVPERVRAGNGLARVGELRAAPIVSVHVWYDERFDLPRMAGFLDGPVHWAFRPPMQPERGTYLTLVTSGAHELVDREPGEIEERVIAEVRRYLPATRRLTPRDVLVAKERAATWAGTPAEQAIRPGTKTSVAGLFLAGDWTATGLPGTIESAVESGERAAEAAAADRGGS
ncbi:MAG: hydroxysqualene dehydroxylase HpnE, partial [Candidatus Binatia bacterium]